MTLRCECGGALEITSQAYSDAGAFEAYECASCRRTGSMSHDRTTGETYSGCVQNA